MASLKNIHFSKICRMIFCAGVIFLASCTETSTNTSQDTSLKSMEDSAVSFNHEIVQSEIQEIDDFILRYHWEMTKTQTGLRYMIYKKGDGTGAKPGDIVAIKYKVTLLTGDLVYQTDSVKLLNFEVGKRNVVSGLEEGIMLMQRGSRAKLIVPSHLAFGLLGDMSKIPARAALVCDVELCAINPLKK
ncbi:MAG: FKBP-type peptidyl-prolyl cis-trans isomerase [Bacteroidota bacterium]